MPQKNRKLILLGGFLVAGLVTVLFWPKIFPGGVMPTLNAWSALLAHWGIFAFAGVYVVAAIFSFPCSPFTVAAGATFGVWAGGWAAILGTAGGAALGYLISRFAARERMARLLARSPLFCRIDEAIGEEGWKIIFWLRFCPIPFGLSNYVYGLTAVRFWPYLLASVAAMAPGNFLFAYVGAAGRYSLNESASGRHSWVTWLPLGLSVASLVGVMFMLRKIATRVMQKKQPELAEVVPATVISE